MSHLTESIAVVELFPVLRGRLLDLLAGLSDEQWRLPTVCPGWSVKDVALHLLGGDVAKLSRSRDGLADALAAYAPPGADLADYGTLITAINAWNADWVVATRRMSGQLLRQLLALTGDALTAYYRGLDLMALGDRISWIGPEPAPVWLDVAREYTEQWMHQAQIRDALGVGGIRERQLFAPVLATFIHGLPRALRDVASPSGTRLRVHIIGEAGGTWDAVRVDGRWLLAAATSDESAAVATLDQEQAWRLWTRGLTAEEAEPAVHTEGDRRLAVAVRAMQSFIG